MSVACTRQSVSRNTLDILVSTSKANGKQTLEPIEQYKWKTSRLFVVRRVWVNINIIVADVLLLLLLPSFVSFSAFFSFSLLHLLRLSLYYIGVMKMAFLIITDNINTNTNLQLNLRLTSVRIPW